jgi:hypothetical protein
MGFTLFREKINPNAEKATQLLNTCTTSRYKLQMRERERWRHIISIEGGL